MLTGIPGYQPTAAGRSLLPVVATLMTLIAILWLFISPSLKIGNELPQDDNSIQKQQVFLQKSQDQEQFIHSDLVVILKSVSSYSILSPEKDSFPVPEKSVSHQIFQNPYIGKRGVKSHSAAYLFDNPHQIPINTTAPASAIACPSPILHIQKGKTTQPKTKLSKFLSSIQFFLQVGKLTSFRLLNSSVLGSRIYIRTVEMVKTDCAGSLRSAFHGNYKFPLQLLPQKRIGNSLNIFPTWLRITIIVYRTKPWTDPQLSGII
jgi:hypothetical protein